MKTIIKCLAGALLLLATSANVQAQRCSPEPISFRNERAIDTTQYVKKYGEVDDQADKFPSFFRHESGVALDSTGVRFDFGDLLEDLYKPIKRKMNRDPKCDRGRCIAALHIRYGLEDTKLRLIYEPLYLRLDSIMPHDKADSMKMSRYERPGKKFTCDGKKFSLITNPAIVTTLTDTYFNKVKKNVGGQWVALTAKDAKGAIFSFQEIVKFNHAVEGPNDDGDYYCNQMEIYHGAVNVEKRPGRQPVIRHTLFFAKKYFPRLKTREAAGQLKILAAASEDDGANLAHLCPPRCNDLGYPVED